MTKVYVVKSATHACMTVFEQFTNWIFSRFFENCADFTFELHSLFFNSVDGAYQFQLVKMHRTLINNVKQSLLVCLFVVINLPYFIINSKHTLATK